MVVQEALRSFAEVNSATNKLKVLHLKILTFFPFSLQIQFFFLQTQKPNSLGTIGSILNSKVGWKVSEAI